MLRYAAVAVVCLTAANASAQPAPSPTAAPPVTAAASPSAKPVTPMEEPKPGDRWTYEVHDEITGTVTATRENVVTEVTPSDITVRYKAVGSGNSEGFNVYDHSWNLLEGRPWRFSPNDGSGIQSPLAVGKTWTIAANNINSANGSIWKRSGTSKVVAQESVTTRAGTFDTFKIETHYSARNANNPTLKNEVAAVTWYAPTIDHWVKRTTAIRADKRLQTSSLIELVDYGRKQ